MWSLITSIWFAGKLTFAPVLVFDNEVACRRGGERLVAHLVRDHVTPTAVRFECIPK